MNTITSSDKARFYHMAEIINQQLDLNGAWFFQVKERGDGTLVLMEIASRLGRERTWVRTTLMRLRKKLKECIENLSGAAV